MGVRYFCQRRVQQGVAGPLTLLFEYCFALTFQCLAPPPHSCLDVLIFTKLLKITQQQQAAVESFWLAKNCKNCLLLNDSHTSNVILQGNYNAKGTSDLITIKYIHNTPPFYLVLMSHFIKLPRQKKIVTPRCS